MKQNKYLAVITILVAVFIFTGAVSAKTDADKDKGDIHKRVIAHTEDEVSKAVSFGCKVVREAKTLKALSCPRDVADSLSLQEDIKLFAVNEDNSLNALRGKPGGGGGGGTVYPNPLNQIGADVVQKAGNTGQGRVVVVLDTGYNYGHPELVSSYRGGWDFVNNDDDPMDDHSHGSHVAGIITADGIDPNAKGVAPDAGVIAGKVLDETGSGYFTDVVAAIYWAVDGPDGVYDTSDDFNADAISLSLGSPAPYLYKGTCNNAYPDMTKAIKHAIDNGIVMVVAAGNNGKAGVSLPGCISYSTTVGAVSNSDKVASFSGRGNALDITAPGVNIYSTVLGGLYATWSGTSMATPMITGTVALIKKAHPVYSQSQVEYALFNTAKDLGVSGKDKDYGWGRVRADKAVQ